MGGTDQMDQNLYYYKTRVRSKKWQIRVFTHFLQSSVCNSKVNYCQDREPDIKMLGFIEKLIRQLATPHLRKPGPKKDSKSEERSDRLSRKFVGKHSPYFLRGGKDKEGKSIEVRKRCKVCHQKTQSGCRTCQIALCLASEENEETPDESDESCSGHT